MRFLLLATVALCVQLMSAADSAKAANLYVNNELGSDELLGGQSERMGRQGPVETINCAIRLAAPGDRIVVAKTATPYREQISISGHCLRGLPHRKFVLESDGAVLDGTVEADAGAWRHVAGNLFAMTPRRLRYQQLFLEGKPLERVRLVSTYGADETLEPMQWALTSRSILLRSEAAKLPGSYGLRHAGLQTGITLYNTRGVVIRGFVIQGFHQDGINAHELVKDCLIENVECRANGRSGISVGGVSRVTASGCKLYDNGQSQARTESLAQLDLNDCDIDKQSSLNPLDSRSGQLRVDSKPVGLAL